MNPDAPRDGVRGFVFCTATQRKTESRENGLFKRITEPPPPADSLLAEFWRLEKEAEAIWRQAVAELAPYRKCLQGEAKLSGAEIVQFLQQLVAEIPWGHNLLILNKLPDPTARLGWSRNVLLNQIKAGAYERARTEKKTHNFEFALILHLAGQDRQDAQDSPETNTLRDGDTAIRRKADRLRYLSGRLGNRQKVPEVVVI